jgi:hypothetical protein
METRTGTDTRTSAYTGTSDRHGPGRAAALVTALAPATLLAGFLAHPFLAVPGPARVAELVEAGATRWAVAHLMTAVASALMAVAFVAVRDQLRAAGDDLRGSWGLPFVVFGSALYAFLPGLEFAPLAVAEAGGDVAAAQAALEPWFIPMFVTGVLAFAAGVFAFARDVRRSAILGTGAARTVAAALVVLAVARAVPLGVVQFHLQSVAAIVALWPLAAAMWRPATSHAHHPSPVT